MAATAITYGSELHAVFLSLMVHPFDITSRPNDGHISGSLLKPAAYGSLIRGRQSTLPARVPGRHRKRSDPMFLYALRRVRTEPLRTVHQMASMPGRTNPGMRRFRDWFSTPPVHSS